MEKKCRGGRYLLCKEGFYSNGRRIKRVFTNYLRANVRDNRGQITLTYIVLFSIISFIYLLLTVLSLYCCRGFSPVLANGSYSSCSAQVSHCGDFSRSLGRVGSVIVAPRFQSTGSIVRGMWDLLGSGIAPRCFLHRQADSLPLGASKEALKHCFLEVENLTSRYNMSTLLKKKVSKWKNIIILK